MTSARMGRSLPLNFLAFLATVVGALLLLVAERPELRGKPGEEAVSAAPAIAGAGQGMTVGGTAFLLYRATLGSRGQARIPAAVEVQAQVERPGAGAPPTA